MTRWSRPGKVNIALLVVLGLVVIIAAGFWWWSSGSTNREAEAWQREAEAMRQPLPAEPNKPSKQPSGVISP